MAVLNYGIATLAILEYCYTTTYSSGAAQKAQDEGLADQAKRAAERAEQVAREAAQSAAAHGQQGMTEGGEAAKEGGGEPALAPEAITNVTKEGGINLGSEMRSDAPLGEGGKSPEDVAKEMP
ncbi:hypothetical protein N2152v2_008297 [Parachlorella kessleri]